GSPVHTRRRAPDPSTRRFAGASVAVVFRIRSTRCTLFSERGEPPREPAGSPRPSGSNAVRHPPLGLLQALSLPPRGGLGGGCGDHGRIETPPPQPSPAGAGEGALRAWVVEGPGRVRRTPR